MSINNVRDFYANSRLHFIGDWRYKAVQILRTLSAELNIPCEMFGTLSTPSGPIIHVDMDCFFASIAMREDPSLQTVPMAVAHGKGHGAELSSCNYLAREFGVKAGMWMKKAKELCPQLVIAPYRFQDYTDTMLQVYRIVLEEGRKGKYTFALEIVSVDEFMISFPPSVDFQECGEFVGIVRKRIFLETKCTASAGIGPNVLIARMCTDTAKPNGQRILCDPTEIQLFINSQPISALYGVGYVMAEKLASELNVKTCAELQAVSFGALQSCVGGTLGKTLHDACKGVCARKINPTITDKAANAIPKTVSCSMNYGIRPTTIQEVHTLIHDIGEELCNKLYMHSTQATKLTLKIKRRHPDAPTETAKHNGHGWCVDINLTSTVSPSTAEVRALATIGTKMFEQMKCPVEDVRGIGLSAVTKVTTSGVSGVRNSTLTQIIQRKRSRDVVDVDAFDTGEVELCQLDVSIPAELNQLYPGIQLALLKRNYAQLLEEVLRLRRSNQEIFQEQLGIVQSYLEKTEQVQLGLPV
eukprot:PhF_6_TR32956/c0_g2_i1/m.48495/K03515/REV1; DNA repair protein REV1